MDSTGKHVSIAPIIEIEDIEDEEETPTRLHGIIRRRKSLPDASEKRKSSDEDNLDCLENMMTSTVIGSKNYVDENNVLPVRRCLNRAASSSKVQYAMIRSAISEGSYLELQTLLRRRDVRINEIEGDGMAAIHFAAMYGTPESVEILINEGAKVNFPNNNGEYPLDIAVKNGNFEIAQFLIEKGARLDNVINGTPSKKEHGYGSNRMRARAKTIDASYC